MNSDSPDKKREELQIALAARRLEIELFWKRAVFFWAFIAAAFAGVVATYDSRPLFAFALSCFGAVCSLFWSLVNRGSKFWYEAWEHVIRCKLGETIFTKAEQPRKKSWWWSPRFSVTKITIAWSDFVTLFWIAIIIIQFCEQSSSIDGQFPCIRVVLLGFSLVYVVFFAICALVIHPGGKKDRGNETGT